MTENIEKEHTALSAKDIQEIKECHEFDFPEAAYELAAQKLGLTELVEEFALIYADHERQGELVMPMYHKRRNAYQRLMGHAHVLLSNESYEVLYKCF
jgi:hypothetical protein